ncbi:MAG: fasciclin domain-containing protein [Microcoleus vaginatus WJT46-NPBG5]|nr:fasciclin domain-containing protein [Microcoleus vaginatus WJT46-NPBG5]
MANIVETAINAGSFNTLVTAIKAANLVDTLNGAGPFTVFAPTDEAFAKLPEGTVEGLLKDIPALKKILTYHVVSGKVMASDVVKLNSATTVQGSDVKIDASNGGVKVNDATVANADVAADNGVIHIIDTVLIPA